MSEIIATHFLIHIAHPSSEMIVELNIYKNL